MIYIYHEGNDPHNIARVAVKAGLLLGGGVVANVLTVTDSLHWTTAACGAVAFLLGALYAAIVRLDLKSVTAKRTAAEWARIIISDETFVADWLPDPTAEITLMEFQQVYNTIEGLRQTGPQ